MENAELIFTIISAVLAVLGALGSFYFSVKNKITQEANNVINTAEDSDKIRGEKMQLAITEIKKIIPAVAKPFFPDSVLEAIIQKAFDGVEAFAKKQAAKKESE